jgi:hypothetical protein
MIIGMKLCYNLDRRWHLDEKIICSCEALFPF